MSITSPEEFQGMRAAGKVVHRMLQAMKENVRPGVTTTELDEIGNAIMRRHGAQPAPAMVYGFPGTSLISLNDEAVHGIPSRRVIQEGDLVKLDVTIEKDGFMADAAESVPAGVISEERSRLMICARSAFSKALRVARAGLRVSEIGRVIEREVRGSGFSVIRELSGHGIGRTIHEKPAVPNFPDPLANQLLTEGLVITIEPIISAGSGNCVLCDDGWTIRTADQSTSAHYEHTVMITRGAPVLLTAA